MNSSEVTGIIDIGSNTVRLAVYQLSPGGAFRIIDQSRWPARLSRRLAPGGTLPDEAVDELSDVLLHFGRICRMHGAAEIRAVATAAVRAAANREEVIRKLYDATGIKIEILSGEQEARLGSQAMLRTLNVDDGYVVDIGGGSTEITLLKDRQIQAAASFPIGCVNLAARYELGEDPVPGELLKMMQDDARKMFGRERWTSEHPGLRLIGLGGTVRAFAKLRQRETEYPFPVLHGYKQSEEDLRSSLDKLADLPIIGRRKLPGLSKDRGDVIISGLAILRAVMRHTGASGLIVCAVGLRDGLYYETALHDMAPSDAASVLEESVRNLNAIYPTAPAEQLEHVRRLSLTIYDRLTEDADFPGAARVWLETAARLFRIGAAIDLNDWADHTFYMLVHTHWNGLSHREILLTAAIASFRGMNALRRKLSPYRSILKEGDIEMAARLGSILQLAAALDRSESQSIRFLQVRTAKNKLLLTAEAHQSLAVERMEVETLAKDFKKVWGLLPELDVM